MLGKSWQTTTEARVLFSGAGSDSTADTVAVLRSEPNTVGEQTILTLAMAPTGRLPIAQVTAPPAIEQFPRVLAAETKLAPAGSTSNNVTPLAADGPLLVSRMS